MNVGPKTAKIPGGLVGKDVDDVEKALRDAGFENVDTNAAKNENPNADPNEVLSVSPKSGSTAALDSKVTVTYATGKSKVPNFNGMTEQRAKEAADDAGFGTPEFTTELSDRPAGTVIAQSPKVDALVDRTTRIQLTLAEAPPPPSTPPPSTPPATPVPTVSPSPSPTSS